MIRIAIFASGKGSNAKAIAHYFKNHKHIEVALIAGNKKTAGVFDLAKDLNIPSIYFMNAELQDKNFLSHLKRYKIDWIVLAGFLLKIPQYLIGSYPNKIINIHPALLPNYGGKGMYGEHVHKAVIQAKEKESGISIHLVNEEYDKGRILHQAKCTVEVSDTVEDLQKKIHQLEYQYFPKVIESTILKNEQAK